MFAGGPDNVVREEAHKAEQGSRAQSNGCVVCGSGQDGDSMLRCDGCNEEYHTYCLVPSRTNIMTGEFYCKTCKDANMIKQHKAEADALVALPITSSPASNDRLNFSTKAADQASPASAAADAPVKSTDSMKDVKYRGVSKVSMKGVKKAFVAKLWQGSKYLQLGNFSSEIEAAHAYDKAALIHYGKSAQINFPHLHGRFNRPEVAPSTRQKHSKDAVENNVTSPPVRRSSVDYSASPARERTRCRGRGQSRGRGKRVQDDVHATDAHSEVKRRKIKTCRSKNGSSNQKALNAPVKNYLGVQMHRVYAHAQIYVNGNVVNLGTFPTAEDAAVAYDKAALTYFGGQTSGSGAHYNDIVLNFPEKRNLLLKQIREEEKEEPVQQVQTSGSSSANRSAQNAKYKLLIMKLKAWLSKLQRSLKMVEAAERVQWGLHSMSRRVDEEETSKQDEDATSGSLLVKMEIFGSGTLIKKEFTTHDQKLRQSSKEIQNAILLIIEELKIYVADTLEDPFSQAPPRCPPILNLLSTSRHLQVVSAINELAHFKTNFDGEGSSMAVSGRIESKLRTIVDYRARLRMSSSNEKQKLTHYVRDMEAKSESDMKSAFPVVGDGRLYSANAGPGVQTSTESPKFKFDFPRNARYVKLKMLITKPDAQNDCAQNGSSEKIIQTREMKEEPVYSLDEAKMVTTADVEPERAGAGEQEKKVTGTSAANASDDAGKGESDCAPKMFSTSGKFDNNMDTVNSGVDANVASQDADINKSACVDASEDTNLFEATVYKIKTEEERRKVDQLETRQLQQEQIGTEHFTESRAEVKSSDDDPKASECKEKADTELADGRIGNNTREDKYHENPFSESKAAWFEYKAVTAKASGEIPKSAGPTSSLSAATIPADDFEFEFCLAIRTDVEDKWRLLPLKSSKTEMVEGFIGDLYLTEQDVLEMEVSEEEVCSFSKTNKETAWMEHLRQLHVDERQVRQHTQRDSDRQHALKGIMKIEQDRLNDVSVVFRETMDNLDMKMSLALMNHERASQDAQLVKLMQHSFEPMVSNLLGVCEEALLNCFRMLSRRFEDFVQEFDYYRNLLLNLTQSSGKKLVTENRHASPSGGVDVNLSEYDAGVKREIHARVSADTFLTTSEVLETSDVSEANTDISEANTDDSDNVDAYDDLSDSSGLRQAYFTFYMGELETLWKERSSLLEMVQAIQRSLLNYTIAEKATLLVEPASPFEASKPTVLEPNLQDMGDEKTTQKAIALSTELKHTIKRSPYNAKDETFENKNETTLGPIDNDMMSADVRMTTPVWVTHAEVDTLKMKSAMVSSDVCVKTEPQLSLKKFRREQELHDAVESCLAQWQCIEWPVELHSTFLTPSSVALSDQSRKMKTDQSQSHLTVSGEEDSAFDPPSSVMDELKRVMIDLTQDQVIPVLPPVQNPTILVMYHPMFINHQTPKNHPECPERIDRVVSILNSLAKKHRQTLKLDRLTMSPEELCPSETTLLMVHSPTYLRKLKERSIEAGSQSALSSTASSSPRALVFESESGIREETPKHGDRKNNLRPPLVGAFGAASLEQNGVELDTFVSSKSWDVARAAAGTVCLAVDRVVRKEYRNAVCLVRPPGHHVGRYGRPENAPSSGFCLLNNVVIGVTHARLYPWIRKVAVLDWDIHHGNGTDELLMDDPDAFFASIHLYSSGKYFPGTGKSCETYNRVNVALETTGAGSGSQAFRSALELKVLPAMRTFRPDIIFISAGFDGHRDDILGGVAAVNNSSVPAGYVEEDFAWATLEALKLAAEVCDGRVVSVLEGGYDVRRETNSLAKSVAAHVAAISAYETARRQSGEISIVELETKESIVDNTTVAASDIASSIKTNHFIAKERTSLLEKLSSADATDDNIPIIDDVENEQEGGGVTAEIMENNIDNEEHRDEEVDNNYVEMEEAAIEGEESHDFVENDGQGARSAMEIDNS